MWHCSRHWDPWPTSQSTEYLLLPSRAVFILTMCSSVLWLSPRCCWFLFVCLLSWQQSSWGGDFCGSTSVLGPQIQTLQIHEWNRRNARDVRTVLSSQFVHFPDARTIPVDFSLLVALIDEIPAGCKGRVIIYLWCGSTDTSDGVPGRWHSSVSAPKLMQTQVTAVQASQANPRALSPPHEGPSH